METSHPDFMLGLTFYSKLDLSSYIISFAKTASKKIGALIRFMKFLSPEVALYLYKFSIRPCMEYYCRVWAGAPVFSICKSLRVLQKVHQYRAPWLTDFCIIHTLSSAGKYKVIVTVVFLNKFYHRPLFNDIYYKTILDRGWFQYY